MVTARRFCLLILCVICSWNAATASRDEMGFYVGEEFGRDHRSEESFSLESLTMCREFGKGCSGFERPLAVPGQLRRGDVLITNQARGSFTFSVSCNNRNWYGFSVSTGGGSL